MAQAKIIIEGCDFLICPREEKSLEYFGITNITAFIATTKEAESYIFGLDTGSTLRTGFGLTFYTHSEAEYKAALQDLRDKKFTVDYAHL